MSKIVSLEQLGFSPNFSPPADAFKFNQYYEMEHSIEICAKNALWKLMTALVQKTMPPENVYWSPPYTSVRSNPDVPDKFQRVVTFYVWRMDNTQLPKEPFFV